MGAPEGNNFAEGQGRPTLYKPEYDNQAYKLCLLRATDSEIADFFNVCEATINNWKNEHESFLESIKSGKLIADYTIAESLFERAKGCTIVKQQAFKVKIGQYEEKIEVVDLEEELPPDTAAIKFWLTNRKSKEWRDKTDVTSDGAAIAAPVIKIGYKTSEED